MNGMIADALLALAVAAAWLGSVAFLLLPTPYDRLHAAVYIGLGVGFFVTLAVIASAPVSALALKAAIIYVAWVGSGAILNHSIGRAMRLRDESSDRP